MITADNIKIDTDEGRYILVIETDDGATLRVDIHGDVFDFYASVQTEIRPYILEAESARREWTAGIPQMITNRPVSVEDAVESGYALDDPKSPGYSERMVD